MWLGLCALPTESWCDNMYCSLLNRCQIYIIQIIQKEIKVVFYDVSPLGNTQLKSCVHIFVWRCSSSLFIQTHNGCGCEDSTLGIMQPLSEIVKCWWFDCLSLQCKKINSDHQLNCPQQLPQVSILEDLHLRLLRLAHTVSVAPGPSPARPW